MIKEEIEPKKELLAISWKDILNSVILNKLSQTLSCSAVGDLYDPNQVSMKAALLNTLSRDSYASSEEYTPTVFDNYSVNHFMFGKQFTIRFWDTSGTEEYDSKQRVIFYPENSDIVWLCFSVMSPESFENIRTVWYPEVRRHCSKAAFLLIGLNKELDDDVDIRRKLAEKKLVPVTYQQGKDLAKEINAVGYIECSSIANIGVKNLFQHCIMSLYFNELSKLGNESKKKNSIAPDQYFDNEHKETMSELTKYLESKEVNSKVANMSISITKTLKTSKVPGENDPDLWSILEDISRENKERQERSSKPIPKISTMLFSKPTAVLPSAAFPKLTGELPLKPKASLKPSKEIKKPTYKP